MAVSYHTHQFEIPTASEAEVIAGTSDGLAVTPASLGNLATLAGVAPGAVGLELLADVTDVNARDTLGLGTAAVEDATAFATAIQGGLADTAVQPEDIGTAAAEDVGFFATAEEGALATTAQQAFDTKAAATAATIVDAVTVIQINGDTTEGDGLGGLYIDTNNGSADTFVSSGGTSRTWYRAADVSESRLSVSYYPLRRADQSLSARLTQYTDGAVVALEKTDVAGNIVSGLALLDGSVSTNFPWTHYDGQYIRKIGTQNGGPPGIGWALSVNFDILATGTTEYGPAVLASSTDRGILGESVVVSGPVGIIETGAETTYGATWMQSATWIIQANVDNGKIKVGMIVDTKHAGRCSGKIESIDIATNRIYVVTGWTTITGTETPNYVTPANGTGAWINHVTHVWGRNDVVIGGRVDVAGNAKDVDVHGRELDVDFQSNMGSVLGDDVVGRASYGSTCTFSAAQTARSDSHQWMYGFYSENVKSHSMWRMNQLLDFNPDTGLTDLPSWLRLEYKFEYGINNVIYTRSAIGKQSAIWRRYVEKNVSYDSDLYNDDIIVFFGSGTYTYKLPPLGTGGIQDGRVIRVVNRGTNVVTVQTALAGAVTTIASANYIEVMYTNSGGWYVSGRGTL